VKVSVITTVKNEEENIGTFLKSLINQVKVPDEIIISDGGSSDRTSEIVEEFIKKNRKFNIKFMVVPGNISFGRNRAIEAAYGNIIAATDAGCRLDPNWLLNITSPFEKDPKIDVVAGWYEPDIKNKSEQFIAAFTHPSLSEIDPDNFLPSGRSVAFKKTFWKRVGGYPEYLPYTGEDTLFDIRLKKAGAKLHFASDAVVYWEPRKNLSGFVKQYFLYSKGDAQAQIMGKTYLKIMIRYLILVALLLLGIFVNQWFWLVLLAGILFYIFRIRERFYRVKSPLAWPLVLVFFFFKDISQLAGYLIGFFSSLIGDQKNETK
jgi:glycosyltransferase involved in cell wall biosynthesis